MQQCTSTHWRICCGDILDLSAEAIICSANAQLNMSGGVGGAILVRHGDRMQQELWSYLKNHNTSFVSTGTVIQTTPCGTPYTLVLHAVAIDVFYQTNSDIITTTIRRALAICVRSNVKTVALTALATGYGKYPIVKFGECIRSIMNECFFPIKTITICMQNPSDAEELADMLFTVENS